MGPGDGQLVRQVLDGDQSAYRLLVQRHEATLFRRARALLGDPDLAADVVQEAFVRAYERLGSCGDPDRFGGWVYRSVRNRCLDELRSARRRAVPVRELDQIPDDADPAADLDRDEIRDAVRAALETLSPPLREAFVLKHVDGLDYHEMQAATGAARSALKMRVKRAREELERQLRPLFGPDNDVTPAPLRTSTRRNAHEPSERVTP